MMNPDKTIKIPPETHAIVTKIAKRQDRTKKSVLRMAVEKYNTLPDKDK